MKLWLSLHEYKGFPLKGKKYNLSALSCQIFNQREVVKVAEHSFQEPMPNSPLLFSHLCFINSADSVGFE